MTHFTVNGRTTSPASQLVLLLLGCLVYLFLVFIGIRVLDNGPLWRFASTNGWLLFISLIWSRRIGIRYRITVGLDKPALGVASVVVFIAFILLLVSMWPDRPGRDVALTDWLLVLLVPVSEELFFRGVLLDYFHKRFNSRTVSLLVVSVLFGLVHLPQGAMVAGVMLVLSGFIAAITLATSSLLWAIAVHIGWNALAVMNQLPSLSHRWPIASLALVSMMALIVWGVASSRRSQTASLRSLE